MHSFHHGGGHGFNAYGGNNHGNGDFTSRRHNSAGNFSSYAKSFEHTSYDDYGGCRSVNAKYDYYEHSRMINFEDSSKDEDGRLAYKSIKTINIFPCNSYLFFEIYFKEVKLFSLVFMENGYEFYFLHCLGSLLEKKHFLEFHS
ncbi:hypothetical protein M9H77_12507 [Catharanthus roseus]|uniref:Uncharacterized protein n=1 Tax=Catharanthus roseus TaxID=4058 RepID=A0ACC0BHT7_CATRO|nr:hypothetical protein M9H77_12507 [Catharanthus roseus]